MTELTLSQRKYTLSIQIYFIAAFVKTGHAECVQTKPDTSLTGDYKILAENGLEMLENYTRRS